MCIYEFPRLIHTTIMHICEYIHQIDPIYELLKVKTYFNYMHICELQNQGLEILRQSKKKDCKS
jgi:hypothetical protein